MTWLSKPLPLEDAVSATSPARLLAKSLTDRETRGEWTRKFHTFGSGCTTIYRNETRDLSVSSSVALYCGHMLSTPFTLSKAEEAIVGDALKEFDRNRSIEAEQAALARLVAPRKGLQRDSGETVKQGSTRRAKARSSKTMRPNPAPILPKKERTK